MGLVRQEQSGRGKVEVSREDIRGHGSAKCKLADTTVSSKELFQGGHYRGHLQLQETMTREIFASPSGSSAYGYRRRVRGSGAASALP